jgi:general secretion pathway protein G
MAAGQPEPAANAGKKRGCLIGSLVGLVALLFFCILAAVVGYFYLKPRLGQAADRARQAQAMVTMQAVAGALESYKNASGGYPAPGHNANSYYSIVDLSSLDKDLVPQYIKALPKDPWGHQYQYGVSQDNQSFVLICTGSDGVDSLTSVPDVPVLTHCYEDDIVLENGQFMQKPAGEQKHCGK